MTLPIEPVKPRKTVSTVNRDNRNRASNIVEINVLPLRNRQTISFTYILNVVVGDGRKFAMRLVRL